MPPDLTIGFRRLPDGSAEPVCDPQIPEILRFLWERSSLVTLYAPRFVVVGTIDGKLTIEGRMEPNLLACSLLPMATDMLLVMKGIRQTLEEKYPAAIIANFVASQAGTRLLYCLDRQFVETEAPRFTTEHSVLLENPRITYDGSRVRVVITGNPHTMPLWQWADAQICDIVQDAILQRVVHTSSAPES